MILTIIIVLTAYCVLLLVIHAGWLRAVHERPLQKSAFYPLISVIIPVRNEEESIGRLLASLKKQSYANYEVIIVNDHSSDQTAEIVSQNRFSNVTVIQNKDQGKKAAIETGVAHAKGEIIATTDADCICGSHWLECVQKTFSDQRVAMAFGAVGMTDDAHFFSALQRVEFASLIGTGAATAALGFPTMCNGANLAYRKECFAEVAGYDGNRQVASGDDEFLMRKFRKRYPNGISFIPYRAASVLTAPQQRVASFFSQRIRWAGKWKHNDSAGTVALAIFIVLAQISVLGAWISLFFVFNYGIILLLFIKLVVEGSLLSRVCRFSGSRFSPGAFLVLQLLYPLYAIATGVIANVWSASWKGRRVTA